MREAIEKSRQEKAEIKEKLQREKQQVQQVGASLLKRMRYLASIVQPSLSVGYRL